MILLDLLCIIGHLKHNLLKTVGAGHGAALKGEHPASRGLDLPLTGFIAL
ncbi:MAG: hypothetical protein WAZ18_02495 [Alphaproteobacteria bacterium]